MTQKKLITFAMVGAMSALSLSVFFRARAQRLSAEDALRLLQAATAHGDSSPDAPTRAAQSSPSEKAPVAPVAATSTTTASSSPAATALSRSDASLLVASHPEIVRLFEAAFRADTRQRYRAFFRRAGLTDEQIDRFERRIFANQVDQLDLTWSARAQGLKRGDPAIKALSLQLEEDFNVDLRTVLGPDGYQALQQFKRVEGARRFVNDVATTMALSSRPLDGDQADQLTQLIGEASASYQKGGNAIPWDANWDLVMEKAPTFLGEAQVAALREIGESQVRFVWLLPQFFAQRQPAP